MRTLKILILASFVSLVLWSISPFRSVEGRNIKAEEKSGVLSASTFGAVAVPNAVAQAQEAPTGFGESLGEVDPEFPFAESLAAFNTDEAGEPTVGPILNATGCGICHLSPAIGGFSQVAEVRAGRTVDNLFFPHPGDTLIHSRSTDPSIQETIMDISEWPGIAAGSPTGTPTRSFRMSQPLFGLGLVETIPNNVLLNNFNRERDLVQRLTGVRPGNFGLMLNVPILEAPGQVGVGRFGWKTQLRSLISFSADAYTNEMGITTPVLPTENSSNGRSVLAFDHAPEGCQGNDCITVPDEEDNADLRLFSSFMRSLKPPPRDAALVGTPAVVRGEQLFGTSLGNSVGCSICHTATFTTPPEGTPVLPATPHVDIHEYRVPAVLANLIFHPYSDFALHNIGTGDGIVQEGMPQQTRLMIRTAPLWGVRNRARLFHDGQLLSLLDAIRAHRNEAQFSVDRFNRLSTSDRNAVISFLKSL